MAEQPAVNVSSTLGPAEIGVLVSIFLFGIVTAQTFTYYKRFSNDRWLLKAFVGVIWVLEFLHAITITHTIYYYSVIRYGKPRVLLELTTTGDITVFLTAIIGPAVQGFSAHRIYILSSKWIIPVIAWVLCLLRLTSLLTLAVICHGALDLIAIGNEWEWLFVIALMFSTSNDVLITVSLCYYLWPHRGATLARTKTIIDKLILWTIQTGLITSCATTIQLVLFLVLDNYGWLAIFLIIPRLFSNSLMASLNARADLRSINEASGLNLDSNLNFALQSTRQTRRSIAMTSVREQRHADVESGKPHGADFGLTEITPHATKREWK